MKKVLVVAAHPDDEVLGCGGMIAKLTSQGVEVEVVIAAEGLTSRQEQRSVATLSKELSELKKTAIIANKILGVSNIDFLGFPDNRMDTVARLDIIKQIENKLSVFRADTIFTHFPEDLNIDHRILSEAVLTASRLLPEQHVQKVYFFEVASSTDWNFTGQSSSTFSPNTYVDITKVLDKKIQALQIYEFEMRAYPHARSIKNVENLSFVRGATAGFESAEAFILAREIIG